ncbi:MAG: CbiX/SirB N-terminal domain-containing protein [Anaerolineae bacterium]
MDNPTVHTALILAGHGSHISPNTAGMVWDLVDGLRAADVDFTANEITAAFWKEMPSFHQVLNTVTATDITVVPIFTANGYFTQTVIPSEMGPYGQHYQTERADHSLCTPPLSEHLDFHETCGTQCCAMRIPQTQSCPATRSSCCC